eukprot:364197-Chlamydomonas_euryale.AAC.5
MPHKQHSQSAVRLQALDSTLISSPPPSPGPSNGRAPHAPHNARIVVFPAFVDSARCEYIIKMAEKMMFPSGLAYGPGERGDASQQTRTSKGTFLSSAMDQDGVLAWVEERIAAATLVPRENGEAFNVLKYENLQHYDSHMGERGVELSAPCACPGGLLRVCVSWQPVPCVCVCVLPACFVCVLLALTLLVSHRTRVARPPAWSADNGGVFCAHGGLQIRLTPRFSGRSPASALRLCSSTYPSRRKAARRCSSVKASTVGVLLRVAKQARRRKSSCTLLLVTFLHDSTKPSRAHTSTIDFSVTYQPS